MIIGVGVSNPAGETLWMQLDNPDVSGINIYNIEGIGPGQANITVSDIATSDGAVFNSARLPSRNIVFYVKFRWSPTIEDARHRSYRFFPIKRMITMNFITDTRNLSIQGYVESNEPVIFEKEEYAQISIVCPYPYFRDFFPNVVLFHEIERLFEFPFSNESLTEKLLIFGEYRQELVMNIVYEADADSGMRIIAHATGPVSNFQIFKIGTSEIMRIDSAKLIAITGSDIIDQDQIHISTVDGDKYVRLLRNGVFINILNTLDRNADWPVLTKGDNLIAYDATSGKENIFLEIEYDVLYEGV